MNPNGGSEPRFTSRSICEYGRSHWWAAQKTPGSCARCLPGLAIERPVPAPGVDAHDPHAPLVQPAGRLGRDGTAPQHVVRLAVEGVPARPQQHDVQRPERVADRRQGGLDVRHLDPLAVGLGGHVEDHAVAEEPLQRQLVDRGGRRPWIVLL